MLLCNESDIAAQVTAFVPDSSETRYRTVVETTISAYSDLSTTVALELEPGGAIPEIHLALTNGDIQLLFSVSNHSPEIIPFALPRIGPIPPPPVATAAPEIIEQKRPSRALNITLFVLLLAVLLIADGVVACRPQVAELSVPPTIPAGTGVSVSYRTMGLGSADYAVLGPEGQTIAAGPLRSGSDRFVISLPRAATAQTYLVRARISNLLGSAFREKYVRAPAAAAVPSPAPAPPRPQPVRAAAAPMIRSFAVDRSTLASGETLDVSYTMLAARGTLALVDPAAQITYAKVQLGQAGHVSFIAPQTDTTRILSVTITAVRGAASAQSRIDVTVTPMSTPVPRDAGGAAGSPDTTNAAFPVPTVALPAVVHSGQLIPVTIHNAGPGLQLVLLAGNGNEVRRHDVQPGASRIEFNAPQVRVPTQVILEALYPNSAQSGPIVRTITVKP